VSCKKSTKYRKFPPFEKAQKFGMRAKTAINSLGWKRLSRIYGARIIIVSRRWTASPNATTYPSPRKAQEASFKAQIVAIASRAGCLLSARASQKQEKYGFPAIPRCSMETSCLRKL
jgi:hypothetical protein